MTRNAAGSPHPTTGDRWTRILTRSDFETFCADRTIRGDDITFVLSSDGNLHGRVGAAILQGQWYWEGGLFCRTASLDNVPLGLDREIIERRGNLMRYTRDAGRGPASVVEVS